VDSVVRQKSLYFVCHSGPDPESSVSVLDSRLRGNDGFGINVKKCWTHYTRGARKEVAKGVEKFKAWKSVWRSFMNETDRNLILEIKKRLPQDVMAHIQKVIAFGSRVRGQGEEDSDLDLLILVDQKTSELEAKIEDIVYQVMWDHDFRPIISIKVFTAVGYRNFLKEGFSFYKNIEREGVSL